MNWPLKIKRILRKKRQSKMSIKIYFSQYVARIKKKLCPTTKTLSKFNPQFEIPNDSTLKIPIKPKPESSRKNIPSFLFKIKKSSDQPARPIFSRKLFSKRQPKIKRNPDLKMN
jgi:hypothetical protein